MVAMLWFLAILSGLDVAAPYAAVLVTEGQDENFGGLLRQNYLVPSFPAFHACLHFRYWRSFQCCAFPTLSHIRTLPEAETGQTLPVLSLL